MTSGVAMPRGIGRVLTEPNPARDAFRAAHEITVIRGKGRFRRLVCSCGRLDKRTVDSNVLMFSSFHHADEWPAWRAANVGCPDGGTCHHDCSTQRCWRVETCLPLSGWGERWPWPVHAPVLRETVGCGDEGSGGER